MPTYNILSRWLYRNPDIETGNYQTKFSLKKLEGCQNLLDISADVRLRFLKLICHNTHLSILEKQPKIDFYFWYLQNQLRSCRPLFENTICFPQASTSLDPFFEVLLRLWQHARDLSNFSLESAVKDLRDGQLITECDDKPLQHDMERQLAFFGLGYLSMLYQPQSDQKVFSADIFQVRDRDPVNNKHRYSPFTSSSKAQRDTGEPFRNFLLDFGKFLPGASRGYDPDTGEDLPQIRPAEFNASIFRSCKITIAWAETLDAHLDFDETKRTLYIFKFPSFCLLNIPANEGTEVENILNRCATGTSVATLELARNRLIGHMKEVILSIHLIFGQSKQSRSVFRPEDAFPNTPKPYQDLLLGTLCREKWQLTSLSVEPKEVYNPKTDFPILYRKICDVHKKMDKARPKGIKELWRDSRDTNQWYTFWAVLAFGGLSLLFALFQTALSAAQLYYSMG